MKFYQFERCRRICKAFDLFLLIERKTKMLDNVGHTKGETSNEN